MNLLLAQTATKAAEELVDGGIQAMSLFGTFVFIIAAIAFVTLAVKAFSAQTGPRTVNGKKWEDGDPCPYCNRNCVVLRHFNTQYWCRYGCYRTWSA